MNKSNTTICAAKKCYSSLLTHPDKNFFGFPSDISLCKTWLENCGRTDLNLKKVSKYSHWRLCEDHFEDKWFTNSSRKLLNRKLNPVPTIFVNNITSLLPLGTEQEAIDADCSSKFVDSSHVECIIEEDDKHSSNSENENSSKKNPYAISYHTKPLYKIVECDAEATKETSLKLIPESKLAVIDDVCRFCMNEVYFNYVDVFSETVEAQEIRKFSEIVLTSKISVGDGLPHKVCQQCVIDLKTCSKLIEQFQNADRYLRSITKASLYVDNGEVTPVSIGCEELAHDIINDNFIEPIENLSMVLPLSPIEKTLEKSYDYLEEINDDDSPKIKNNVHVCEYKAHTSKIKNLKLGKRSKHEGSAKNLSTKFKRQKQLLNIDSKCYKNRKKNQSKDILNKIIVLTDHLDYNTQLDNANHNMP